MASEIPLVGIIMGSDSDLKIIKEAADILNEFKIKNEIKVLSAHRAPKHTAEYASTALQRGIKVIIAGAGGAAHLPGVIAGHTSLPVIGVPVKSKSLDGLDSLLSIVQMPSGVPVATVGINQAKNAGLLAVQILSLSDKNLMEKMIEYKKKLERDTLSKNQKLDPSKSIEV
jgi:5-(carboxyamino)imidazole ribonucleotide mutase